MKTLKKSLLAMAALFCIGTSVGCGSPICSALTDKFKECGINVKDCDQKQRCSNEEQIMQCIDACSCGNDYASSCIAACLNTCQSR